MNKSNKRKIIEIYVTENKEDNNIKIDFEKVSDTEIANAVIKKLVMMVASQKDEGDKLEVHYE